MIVFLFLASLLLPDNCWSYYDWCRAVKYQEKFNFYLTGPDEVKYVADIVSQTMKPLNPGDIWPTIDYDKDGDVDLRDYHLYLEKI
jgi:hypothetical protein